MLALSAQGSLGLKSSISILLKAIPTLAAASFFSTNSIACFRSEYGSIPRLSLWSSTGVANVLHALCASAVPSGLILRSTELQRSRIVSEYFGARSCGVELEKGHADPTYGGVYSPF